MQVCVVGAGLAGSMLAWRLAQRDVQLTLITGPAEPRDATALSGGSVRAFEVDPAQRSLALDSMAELQADRRLAEWAGYLECGSVYLPSSPAGLADTAAQINAVLPDSAGVVIADQLRAAGWAGLDDDMIGLAERTAGYLSPARLRAALLADLVHRRNTSLRQQSVSQVADGAVVLGGRRQDFDLVVLAAGAWTPQLLAESGFDPDGLTTKGIQYTLHEATGVPRTGFVDDRSDLFGRPTPDGVLLGLPTTSWGVSADELAPDRDLAERAARLAMYRFPSMRLGPASAPAVAVDCYAPDHLLALRPVAGSAGRLFTFSGGSGGSVKTSLAASNRAAQFLSHPPVTLQQQPESERSALTS